METLGLFNTDNPDKLLKVNNETGLGNFYGVVSAEGPSKVATIKLDASIQPFFGGRKKKLHGDIQAHLSLRGIGISIVNKDPQELVYIFLSDVGVDFAQNRWEQKFEFTLQNLQIDNQQIFSQYPVMVWRAPNSEPFFFFSFARVIDYTSVHYIRDVVVSIDDLDICMDDEVFLGVWNWVLACGRIFQGDEFEENMKSKIRKQGKLKEEADHLNENYYFQVPKEDFQRRFFLRDVSLNESNLLITFINTNKGNSGLRENDVSRIIRTVGALANIERAPVKLQSLLMKDVFLSRGELYEYLFSHYYAQIRKGFAKIIASADFLGSPMALAGMIKEGAHDFVTLPGKMGREEGVKGTFKGIGLGTKSLVKSVSYGTFNSLSKISGSVGDGLSSLAMDENYEKQREVLGRSRPQHVGQGLLYGARDLGLGLFRGISGVFTEPVRGAKRDGVRGFFVGISRGITGLYVKPGVGAVDLLTRTAEGIRNTTTYWEDGEKVRVRLPRYIGNDGLIEIYSDLQVFFFFFN